MISGGVVELDQVALNSRLRNLAFVDLVEEVGENYFGFFGLLPAEDIEQEQEHQSQH
jgi:hypothetical protein